MIELELELIQTQMAQKKMLRAEVYARALRTSQKVKRSGVWDASLCATLNTVGGVGELYQRRLTIL
jgi:hypothetical protein